MTFTSSSNSAKIYNLLKSYLLNVSLIQTPCHLTAGCSRSVVVKEEDIDKALEIIKDNNVETNILAIHKKSVNAKIKRYEFEEIEF